jgi:16S rRNA (uracil1498-N3)-methyltransferase
VRRLGAGESVVLTDGAGLSAEGVVSESGGGVLVVQVAAVHDVPAPQPRVVVVQALPKGERAEAAVATLTEVGVDVIVPWAATRCVTRWRPPRGDKALQQWRSSASEAAKQSRRTWWPQVEELADTRQVASRLRAASLAVVLHESASTSLAHVAVGGSGDAVLVVGPEGGLTEEELAEFAAAGAVRARLGPTVLRTSTAGTVGAAVLLSRTGRWA